MPIQKNIFQTYKNAQLPWLTQWHIYQLKKTNPEHSYYFYDDERVAQFIYDEYGADIFTLYQRINIGAAKADFFRYAILYKQGGVYLDIDSLILKKLDHFILPTDEAIIALEANLEFYVQFVLFYSAGHPFLSKVIEYMLHNLKTNSHPYDVHKMTGPTVYTLAINDCIKNNPEINYRQLGIDYDKMVKFSYPMSKFFLYGLSRKNHWRQLIKNTPILKEIE